MVSMVYVFLVVLLATRPWTISTMQEKLDGTKTPGMKRVSMVIVSLASNLVTKPWTIETMQKEVLEILNTLLDVGHVIELVTLLQTVILGDVTVAMGLVIRPKNVVTQEEIK